MQPSVGGAAFYASELQSRCKLQALVHKRTLERVMRDGSVFSRTQPLIPQSIQ
jgi:hypothetical protein